MCLCVRAISLTLERNNFDVNIRSGGSTGSSCGQGQAKVQGYERKTLLKWPVRSQVRAFLGGIAIRVKFLLAQAWPDETEKRDDQLGKLDNFSAITDVLFIR